MTKWEYHTEPALSLEELPRQMGDEDNSHRVILNHAGKFGWEAFAAWPVSSDGRTFCVLFKRPVD